MKHPRIAAIAVLMFSLLAAAGAPAAGPDWRLPDLEGRPTGPADFSGDWVVVNYWATWCKPCREEMPALDELARENDDVTVLGVAWEDTGIDELKQFLERVPVSYPVLSVDPFEPDPAIEPPRVLPTTLVFNPGGELAERFHGPVTRGDIQAVIDDGKSNPGDEP